MRVRLELALTALAAASWGVVIAADTANLHSHLERDMLAVAAITTALAIQCLFFRQLRRSIDKMGAAYSELARAVATRPLYRDPTGPIPVPPPAAAPGGAARPQRARHATR